MWINPGNIKIAHRHIILEMGIEAVQFPEKEYISGIFVAVWNIALFHIAQLPISLLHIALLPIALLPIVLLSIGCCLLHYFI